MTTQYKDAAKTAVPIVLSYEELRKREYDKELGRDIAFGIQQTAACFATDFIDPPISKFLQNRYGNKDHYVTHQHVWGGEITGDLTAFAAYLAIKRGFREQVKSVTNMVKSTLDPWLTKRGKGSLKGWAAQEHLSESDNKYQEQLEAYKDFQAENLVDSTIVATSATSLNVLAQKYLFKNGQNIQVILGSKVAGAIMTMGVMLGVRTVIPTTTESLDNELSDRYFSKLIRFTKKIFGVKYEDTGASLPHAEVSSGSGAATVSIPKLTGYTRDLSMRLVAKHALVMEEMGRDPAQFMEDEIRLLTALRNALSNVADVFANEHYKGIQKHYQCLDQDLQQDESIASLEISKRSVESIIQNRRADLAILIQELKTPEAQQEIGAFKQNPGVLAKSLPYTKEKREELINSLLQPQQSKRGEPAVHIFANARGQMIEHGVLAECFRKDGPVADKLAEEMQRELKDFQPALLKSIANDYLGDRRAAALTVAEYTRAGSEVVKEALERSARLQQKYHQTSAGTLSFTS